MPEKYKVGDDVQVQDGNGWASGIIEEMTKRWLIVRVCYTARPKQGKPWYSRAVPVEDAERVLRRA